MRPAGLEPATPWFEAKYSNPLSYGRQSEFPFNFPSPGKGKVSRLRDGRGQNSPSIFLPLERGRCPVFGTEGVRIPLQFSFPCKGEDQPTGRQVSRPRDRGAQEKNLLPYSLPLQRGRCPVRGTEGHRKRISFPILSPCKGGDVPSAGQRGFSLTKKLSFPWAATGNRTQIPSATNLCPNRWTIAAVFFPYPERESNPHQELRRLLLYPLSYRGSIHFLFLEKQKRFSAPDAFSGTNVRPVGIEPTTVCLRGNCSTG